MIPRSIILRCKILIQNVSLKGLDWDEPVDGHLKERWINLLDDLKNLANIQIPRFVYTSELHYSEIHAFADLSERAWMLYLSSF